MALFVQIGYCVLPADRCFILYVRSSTSGLFIKLWKYDRRENNGLAISFQPSNSQACSSGVLWDRELKLCNARQWFVHKVLRQPCEKGQYLFIEFFALNVLEEGTFEFLFIIIHTLQSSIWTVTQLLFWLKMPAPWTWNQEYFNYHLHCFISYTTYWNTELKQCCSNTYGQHYMCSATHFHIVLIGWYLTHVVADIPSDLEVS